ncbi:unnamed protein product, partial [Laminaria digitata]
MPQSFLDLALSMLADMKIPSLYWVLMRPWHFKLRHAQSVVVEALTYVTEEQLAAYVESVVRGNKEVWRCEDIVHLIPDAHGLRSNRGSVIIRDAYKRECDRTRVAQV